jgi:tetratricopeptide (TPR) repeat protein
VVTDLQEALVHKPRPATELTALNNLAWVLATCPDDSVRNGIQAVQYAEKACRLTGFKQSGMINTLAAAYAESGRFPEAVATAQTAIKLANDAGDRQAVAATSQLLARYQQGKPWREKNSK